MSVQRVARSGGHSTVAFFTVWQLAADLPKGRTPGEEHYRCIHRWVHARRANRSQEEIGLRKMLQASHPVLFRALKRTV